MSVPTWWLPCAIPIPLQQGRSSRFVGIPLMSWPDCSETYGPRFRCETICIFCKKSWSQRAKIEIQDVWLIWSLRLPISSIWNSESYHFLHGFVIDVWWLLDFGIPATQSTQFQQKSQAAPSTSCCSSSKLGSGTESLGLRGAWMLGFKQLFLV